MTDILDQIDDVLAKVQACACGCGKSISEKGPSGDFAGEWCQARWMARQLTVRPKVVTFPPRCPACGLLMEVPGRYCEPCAIALSSRVAVPRPVDAVVAAALAHEAYHRPTSTFTLADMEAASAAVRALHAPPVDAALEEPDPPRWPRDANGRLIMRPRPVGRDTVDLAEAMDASEEPIDVRPWWRRMLGAQR